MNFLSFPGFIPWSKAGMASLAPLQSQFQTQGHLLFLKVGAENEN